MKLNNKNVITETNTITNTKPQKGTLDLYSDDYVKINYYIVFNILNGNFF